MPHTPGTKARLWHALEVKKAKGDEQQEATARKEIRKLTLFQSTVFNGSQEDTFKTRICQSVYQIQF